MLSIYDGLNSFNRRVYIIIFHNIVVLRNQLQLFSFLMHTILNDFSSVSTTINYSRFYLMHSRWCKKNAYTIWHTSLNLQCTLILYFKENILTLVSHFFNVLKVCSIVVAHIFSILQQT